MKRDNITLAMMVMMPIAQLLVFGFVINTDVKHLKAVVFDQSVSAESRDLLSEFTASEYFDIKYVVSSFESVNQKIESGDAKNSITLLWGQIFALVIFIAATLGLAIKKFSKTLD
jgi:ABC-2 type transport system permease protein